MTGERRCGPCAWGATLLLQGLLGSQAARRCPPSGPAPAQEVPNLLPRVPDCRGPPLGRSTRSLQGVPQSGEAKGRRVLR